MEHAQKPMVAASPFYALFTRIRCPSNNCKEEKNKEWNFEQVKQITGKPTLLVTASVKMQPISTYQQ